MAEYIEREALLDDIENTLVFSGRPDRHNPKQIGAQMVLQRIRVAPAADVAPVVHGRWEAIYYTRIHNGATSFEGFMCSVCKKMKSSKFDFCPNCGARMDGE